MMTVTKKDQCTGCKVCVNICSRDAIRIKDSLQAYNAVIDAGKCINCDACRKVCPSNQQVEVREPILWKQGWIGQSDLREKSSSGGAAAAFARAFVQAGGLVCSCLFQEGHFTFALTDDENTLAAFAGSKYVKSDPGEIYPQIREALKEGKKVLFLGLPCQSAAVQSYVGQKLQQNLYTVDLICHGSPSPAILDNFLKKYDKSLSQASNISFRRKSHFQLEIDGEPITPHRVRDHYTQAFLSCLVYTENCYACRYAQTGRVSDLSIGDSWRSNLEEEEKKGISLILCQTEKGRKLLEESGLTLCPVDPQAAIANNGQLRHPSKAPNKRSDFFRYLKNGSSFDQAYAKCYPKQYYKNRLKESMIKMHLLSENK